MHPPPIKTILIDDEEASHVSMANLLGAHPDIELVGAAYSVGQGLELIRAHEPELVLLDIMIGAQTGFELLQHFEQPPFQVVFISGYDQYGLSAIKFGAVDYLVKPVVADDFAKAVQRVRERRQEKLLRAQVELMQEAYQLLREQRQLPSRMGVSTNEGIIFIPIKDIIRLKAETSFTQIFLSNPKGKKIMTSVNLKEYEDQFLPYREFMRVHRSHLVNLTMVERYVKSDGGYLVMNDGDPKQVDVSERYKEALLKRLSLI